MTTHDLPPPGNASRCQTPSPARLEIPVWFKAVACLFVRTQMRSSAMRMRGSPTHGAAVRPVRWRHRGTTRGAAQGRHRTCAGRRSASHVALHNNVGYDLGFPNLRTPDPDGGSPASIVRASFRDSVCTPTVNLICRPACADRQPTCRGERIGKSSS